MGLQLQDSDIFEEFILASQLHGCDEDGYIWEKLLKNGKFLSYNDYNDDVEDIYDEDDDIKEKVDVSSSIDGGYHSHDDSGSSISDLIEFDIGIQNGGGTEKERCRPIRVSIDSGFGDCSDIDEEEEEDDDDYDHEKEKKEEKRRIWKNKCAMRSSIDSNLECYELGVKDFEGDDDDSDDEEEKEEKKRNWKNKCVMQSFIGSNLESFGQEIKDFKDDDHEEEEEEKEREEKKIVVACVSDNDDDDDDDFDDDEEDPGFNDDYLEEEEDESKENILTTMDDGDNENENNEDENDDDDDKKENPDICDGNGDHAIITENIEANHEPGCLITGDEVYEYDGEGCHGDAPNLLLDTRANDDEYYDLAGILIFS